MKKILLICPYGNIYPPLNGGAQRYFNVLHQLARHFDVTAIIHQDKKSFLQCKQEFPPIASVEIYSTEDLIVRDIFNLFPGKLQRALRSRWYQRELIRPADGSLIRYYPILKQLLKEQRFDAIILENNATLNAVNIIRRYDKQVKIIYNAHNVETNLVKAALGRKEISSKLVMKYQDFESQLYKKVDAVFTCSNDDKKIFEEMNDHKLKVEVIPNGVNVPSKKYADAVNEQIPQFLIFCGSLWSIPNAEGLHWFCNKIWPQITKEYPHLKLLVVGSGELPVKYSINQTENIEFTGAVNDVKEFYNKATISIVPLLTGSGTRLKILEAMGMGVPVVSSSKGAEGINSANGFDILIADNEELFAKQVIELLKNKEQRLAIQKNALKLVSENYDWNIIGDSMSDFITNKLSRLKTLKLNFGYFWPSFDKKNNFFTRLLSKRYNVVVSDDPDFYIFTHSFYNNNIKEYQNYNCHRIFFGFENVRADWKNCDYVVDSDYSNHARHKRRPLWAGFITKELTFPKDLRQFQQKKKFCCMLVSNPNAKERIEFFHQLSKYKKVDSAGRYLNNVGFSAENKKEFIKDYKFVISFENSSYPGYTTEKLIEPMLVNSIPIYWGNPRVGDDFNTKSFININDFRSFDEAIQYIIELDNDEEKYLALASQPWFNVNKIAEEYSEESLLDFFDFIVEDSKRKKPVARKNAHYTKAIKDKIIRALSQKYKMFESFKF